MFKTNLFRAKTLTEGKPLCYARTVSTLTTAQNKIVQNSEETTLQIFSLVSRHLYKYYEALLCDTSHLTGSLTKLYNIIPQFSETAMIA